MRVVEGKIGTTYTIKKINLEPVIERRLEILGMTEGSKLMVMNKRDGGAIIIKIRGTRFAIGLEIAKGIQIGCVKDE